MNVLKQPPLDRFYTETPLSLKCYSSFKGDSRYATRLSMSQAVSQKSLFSYSAMTIAYLSKKGLDAILLPLFLIKESQKITQEHFGLDRQYWVNNILFIAVSVCALSGLWINPLFDETLEKVNRIVNTPSAIESDEVFYEQLFNALTRLGQTAALYLFKENFFEFLNDALSARIAARKQTTFIIDYLKNGTHYGIHLCKAPSKTEDDNYKNDLNPVQLYKDFESYNDILSLVIERFKTFINLYTAYIALEMIVPHFISFNILFTTITMPYLFVVCVGYSLVYNILSSLFEYPLAVLNKHLQHLLDKLTFKIGKVGGTASEQIAFLEGAGIETKKLLELHHQKTNTSLYYRGVSSGKTFIQSFLETFIVFVPLIVCIKELRAGTVKREQFTSVFNNYDHVSKYLSWAKENFTTLNTIEESTHRIDLFNERIAEWQLIFATIDAQFQDAEDIYFKGTIYNEGGSQKILLAQGELKLNRGHIYHFDAPSGSGKTTLFKLFCRIWPHFDGIGSLPKSQTFFLPSTPYILDEDEPLIQTIAYPSEHSTASYTDINSVKRWMKDLSLSEQIIKDLQTMGRVDRILNWMLRLSDGERKRVAFLNLILKLKAEVVRFVVLDEPFKGVDRQTQVKMVKLLKLYKPDDCTVLFSNHEDNHGLNMCVIRLTESKEFNIQFVKQHQN